MLKISMSRTKILDILYYNFSQKTRTVYNFFFECVIEEKNRDNSRFIVDIFNICRTSFCILDDTFYNFHINFLYMCTCKSRIVSDFQSKIIKIIDENVFHPNKKLSRLYLALRNENPK